MIDSRRFINITLLAFVLYGIAGAQSDKHVLTKITLPGLATRGGFINAAEGAAVILREPNPPHDLKMKDVVENGDIVRTSANGRVEILLNPGYYLRLANDTEISVVDLAPTNLKLKLRRGVAIVEVAINESLGMPLWSDGPENPVYELASINSPDGEFVITRGGLYRFDAEPDGTSLRVTKGVAVVGGSKVSDGMVASAHNNGVNVARAAKGPDTAFDAWSQERATRLITVNRAFKNSEWYKALRGNDRNFIEFQDEDAGVKAEALHTVSARRGVVSFVEDVTVIRRGKSESTQLKAGDNLSDGDKVTTAKDSRAEIHPVPNSYLHLGGDSEILYSEGDDDVSVDVARGSAILVYEADKKGLVPLTLGTRQAKFEIVKAGIYRLNVKPNGAAELLVFEGAVRSGQARISATRRLIISGANFSEAPLKKTERDSLNAWSSKRSMLSSAILFKRNFTPISGVWILYALTGEYTFVPGRWEFRSPYGGNYSIKYKSENARMRMRLREIRGPAPSPVSPFP